MAFLTTTGGVRHRDRVAHGRNAMETGGAASALPAYWGRCHGREGPQGLHCFPGQPAASMMLVPNDLGAGARGRSALWANRMASS